MAIVQWERPTESSADEVDSDCNSSCSTELKWTLRAVTTSSAWAPAEDERDQVARLLVVRNLVVGE